MKHQSVIVTHAAGEGRRVYVGELPETIDARRIFGHFSKFGNVLDIKMMYSDDGLCRGYCFVTYSSSEEAHKLLANYDNNVIGDKWVACKPALCRWQRLDQPRDWCCAACGERVAAWRSTCKRCFDAPFPPISLPGPWKTPGRVSESPMPSSAAVNLMTATMAEQSPKRKQVSANRRCQMAAAVAAKNCAIAESRRWKTLYMASLASTRTADKDWEAECCWDGPESALSTGSPECSDCETISTRCDSEPGPIMPMPDHSPSSGSEETIVLDGCQVQAGTAILSLLQESRSEENKTASLITNLLGPSTPQELLGGVESIEELDRKMRRIQLQLHPDKFKEGDALLAKSARQRAMDSAEELRRQMQAKDGVPPPKPELEGEPQICAEPGQRTIEIRWKEPDTSVWIEAYQVWGPSSFFESQAEEDWVCLHEVGRIENSITLTESDLFWEADKAKAETVPLQLVAKNGCGYSEVVDISVPWQFPWLDSMGSTLCKTCMMLRPDNGKACGGGCQSELCRDFALVCPCGGEIKWWKPSKRMAVLGCLQCFHVIWST